MPSYIEIPLFPAFLVNGANVLAALQEGEDWCRDKD